MEHKVDALMRNAISIMVRSEGIFRMKSNEMYQIPLEPSRQEEFEHIVVNFILDQEERVKQLEEYMKVIVGDFMQLSSEVTKRLKEKIIEEGSRIRKIEKITKYLDIVVPKTLSGHKFSESSEIHVTLAHLEKKRTKLRTYTKSLEELCNPVRGDGVTSVKRRRQNLSSDDVRKLTTTTGRNDSNQT
nr:hypothetical protein [Tanacetum cinerariifolium]